MGKLGEKVIVSLLVCFPSVSVCGDPLEQAQRKVSQLRSEIVDMQNRIELLLEERNVVQRELRNGLRTALEMKTLQEKMIMQEKRVRLLAAKLRERSETLQREELQMKQLRNKVAFQKILNLWYATKMKAASTNAFCPGCGHAFLNRTERGRVWGASFGLLFFANLWAANDMLQRRQDYDALVYIENYKRPLLAARLNRSIDLFYSLFALGLGAYLGGIVDVFLLPPDASHLGTLGVSVRF